MFYTAGPLGTYLGGILLGSGTVEPGGQLHDYERVYCWCAVTSITSFFWVLIFINENKKQPDETASLINTAEDDLQEYSVNYDTFDNINNNEPSTLKQADRCEHRDELLVEVEFRKNIYTKFTFSKMFDLENIRDVFRTAVKKRPNKGRLQLWLLYLSMATIMLSGVKDFNMLFPFVEEVYDWDAKEFSQIKSMSSIVAVVMTALVSFSLSGFFKVSDTKMGLIGFVSVMFAALSIGSVISPVGLYLMYILGSPSAVASTSIRSLLSKIASDTESGKVFSLLAAIETVVPPTNVLVYNSLFEYTIDFYPSLAFQIAGGLQFIPIFIYLWIDSTRMQFY